MNLKNINKAWILVNPFPFRDYHQSSPLKEIKRVKRGERRG